MLARALSAKRVSGARPGSTRCARTPNGSSSTAIDSVNAFTAALLARYALTSGNAFSVTLDVTFTTTPAPRARNCGSTACVTAIVPIVLVSNSARTVSSGVSSAGAAAPKPALLTSTSIGPAASIAVRMLSAFVTSSGSTRKRSDGGSTSSPGLRIVATTRQSRARKWRAISRPKPEEQPVISTVFMRTPGVC